MIGSMFYHHPEILLQSLTDMNESYQKNTRSGSERIISVLQRVYIRVFGIPEIGFQVRSMYFQQAVDKISAGAPPGSILDVGSGIGSYVFELSKMFPLAAVDGWEIDRNKLTFAKKFADELGIKNVSFSYGDVTKKPKVRARYDFVLTVDVLEHVEDYRSALRHMNQVIKPGGHLYIHTPAHHQRRFFRVFRSWEHEDHVREGFDPEIFGRDLKKAGFSDIHIRHSFGPIGSLAWELNHLLLAKSFVLAGIFYPFLYLLSRCDALVPNRRGLCISVIARKRAKK